MSADIGDNQFMPTASAGQTSQEEHRSTRKHHRSHRDRDRRHGERTHRRDKHRRRRRHSSASSDEEDTLFGFSTWKTVAVFGIILACFAVLYPKMFHPMLMYVIYGAKKEEEKPQHFPHPSMRGGGPTPGGRPPSMGPRPGGPGPGMAGASGYESGGGKRGWHWMLPFYTVGVIIFLLYTLSKIFWKKPKSKRKYNLRYNTKRDRFEVPQGRGYSDSDSDDDDDEADSLYPGRLKKRELKVLQDRLMQTEGAMQKILEQLEQLSGNVDEATADAIRQSTMDTLSNLADTEDKAKQMRERSEEGDAEGSGGGESDASGSEDVTQSDSDEVDGRHQRKQPPERRPRKGRATADKTSETARYLGDLEKALNDFRSLTENYVQQKTTEVLSKAIQEEIDKGKQQKLEKEKGKDENDKEMEGNEAGTGKMDEQNPTENGVNVETESESEESENQEFDAMEGEDLQNLEMPEPVGTITRVSSSDDENEQNNQKVRKRH